MVVDPIVMPFKGVLPTLGEDVFIAPGAAVIGDVQIGAGSSVWFSTVVRGDVHEIRIGARTNIQDGTVVHVTGGKLGTYIGDDVTIGHKALLHACTLRNGCFVGMGATVMDGAVVEESAMVAAGALVTPGKVVASGELWAGSPARFMRKLSREEMDYFPVSAAKYAALAKTYLDARNQED